MLDTIPETVETKCSARKKIIVLQLPSLGPAQRSSFVLMRSQKTHWRTHSLDVACVKLDTCEMEGKNGPGVPETSNQITRQPIRTFLSAFLWHFQFAGRGAGHLLRSLSPSIGLSGKCFRAEWFPTSKLSVQIGQNGMEIGWTPNFSAVDYVQHFERKLKLIPWARSSLSWKNSGPFHLKGIIWKNQIGQCRTGQSIRRRTRLKEQTCRNNSNEDNHETRGARGPVRVVALAPLLMRSWCQPMFSPLFGGKLSCNSIR